jgi:N-hydroxyarylamine O-acetyltransferase
MTFDLFVYFERAGLKACPPTLAGLRQLSAAQMHAIPFENIQPFLGEVPDLSAGAIWQKLVVDRRGGYCFELNSLLGSALRAIGFSVRLILARVRMGAPAGGPRSHHAWIVAIEGGEWLVDAGFGGPGPAGPLQLGVDAPQDIAGTLFRLRADRESGETVLERQTGDTWFSLYGFDHAPVNDADIEAANFLCARWEKAPFPQNLMLNLHRTDGRVSFFNTSLRIETDGSSEVRTIGSRNELEQYLKLFRLPCDPAMLDALWQRLRKAADRPAA